MVRGELATSEAPATLQGKDAIATTLFAFATASFLVALDRAIFSPLLPEMAADLDTTVGRAGLGVTAYVLPYGFFQLLFGPLGDRIGRVQVTRWCFLVFAVGTGLAAFAPSLGTLILLRAATGMCAAAVIPLALAYIGDVIPYESRQRAITNLMGATSTGNALSTAVGGILGSFVSWRAVFGLYGLIAIVVSAVFFRLPAPKPPIRDGSSSSMNYRAVLAQRPARLVYGLVALEGVVVLGAFTYLGSYLRERFALDYFVIGLILACYGIGILCTSRIFFPRVFRRFPEQRLTLFGGIFLGIGYLSLAELPIWQLTPLPIFIAGIGFALLHSTLQTRATEFAPGARGSAVSLFVFCAFAGGGLGSAGFGWVVGAHGYEPVLVFSGLLMLFVGTYAALKW